MNKILIHKSNNNTSVTHFMMDVSDSAIRQEADKILEFGQCFRIADASELPEDRVFRDAWEIDDSDLNDGIAGEFTARSNLSMFTKSKSLQEEDLNKNKQRLSDLPEIIKQKETQFKLDEQVVKDYEAKITSLQEELDKLDPDSTEQEVIDRIDSLRNEIGIRSPDLEESKQNLDQFSERILNFKKELENLPQTILDIESWIEQISADILDAETKINQLLETLPLDKRRSSND
jgi:hypothetical protein